MFILGISAFYHDSAACLVHDGELVAAAQEERFSRKKHDADFPENAIRFCLNYANIKPDQVDYVVFYDKPFLKFERLLETYLAFAPRGFKSFMHSFPVWIKDKLFQKKIIIDKISNTLGSDIDWRERLLFSEHHISHAASAFFPSPYEKAIVLTMDGVGEWATTSFAIGDKNTLTMHKEINFPHSLGLLYSAFTYYLGFKVNSGEYKVMGLAPYGEPIYVDLIKGNLIDIKDDGSYWLDMSYFNYASGLTMTSKKFDFLFGAPPRAPESDLTQREMDIAASIQKVTEEVVVKLAKKLQRDTGIKNLCLAGGVALNCVANGKLVNEDCFAGIWIQPAAGDAGGALGSALSVYYTMFNKARSVDHKADMMKGAYLGPEYSQEEIHKRLDDVGAIYQTFDENEIVVRVVKDLVAGRAVGWHQGRMEFGPRALGARSILADPRSPIMQKKLNLKVKFRESFRPFAPSVMLDDVREWFKLDVESPYMLIVAEINDKKRMQADDEAYFGIDKLNVQRSVIPAVTHVDYSARVQTVSSENNPLFYRLLKEFKDKANCPVLVNTSFNVRGEPIVMTPEDAFRCFMGTDLDVLVVGNSYLVKNRQKEGLKSRYEFKYELD